MLQPTVSRYSGSSFPSVSLRPTYHLYHDRYHISRRLPQFHRYTSSQIRTQQCQSDSWRSAPQRPVRKQLHSWWRSGRSRHPNRAQCGNADVYCGGKNGWKAVWPLYANRENRRSRSSGSQSHRRLWPTLEAKTKTQERRRRCRHRCTLLLRRLHKMPSRISGVCRRPRSDQHVIRSRILWRKSDLHGITRLFHLWYQDEKHEMP